jgi:hypothetical protein
MRHFGSCLCGGVALKINGPLAPIRICHCSQCRKAQGGPIATNIPVAVSDLEIQDENGFIRVYESSPDKERLFCGRCGSPILSRRHSIPDVVRVRAGLLSEPVHATLDLHAYTGSMASWWTLDDDLPKHEEGYVPPPDA